MYAARCILLGFLSVQLLSSFANADDGELLSKFISASKIDLIKLLGRQII